ncbi:response regulator [Dongia sedimenti]|uniref:Response regulator n=1 Tax=Dongia sedimenti TaxID=3064282 RepID=A0ABU0YKV1_9PROT|nr:response regulator [Rhodospirillaceae bacterium R-7]
MAKIESVKWSALEQAVTAGEEKRPSILVVDDDHAFCETIARCLAQRGYDVTCADSGEVAAVAINEQHPDVIVTDVQMPGMDGIDLMNWLRDCGLDIPVIVISGEHIDEGEFGEKTVDCESGMAAAAQLGAVSVLHKPFGRALLEDSVAKALTYGITLH